MSPEKLEVGPLCRATATTEVCNISQIWLILQLLRLCHTIPRPTKENCKYVIEQVKYALFHSSIDFIGIGS